MNPELQAVCDGYRARLAGRPVEWCRLHPRGDDHAWSPQQLVEHLVLAMRSSAQVLEARIEKGRPSRANATLIQGLRRTAVLTFRRLPRGIPAPPFVRPGQLDWPPMDGSALVSRFYSEVESTARVLTVFAESFGNSRAASHFLLGPLSAEEWRRFHVIHCRHHLAQLRRIESAIGPAAPDEPAADRATASVF